MHLFFQPTIVEWLYVDVTLTNTKRQAVIFWATKKEFNNSHFTILRSFDGNQFEAIGKVEGNGTTLEVRNYSFIDNKPFNGRNYYRIRQVDADSLHQSYSNVIRADVERAPIDQALIYPNPAEGYFYIELPKESINDEVIIELYDGAAVIQKTIIIPSATVAPIPIENIKLINGVYWLHIRYNQKKIIKPVMISNLY
ncbi:MAG: T9SS type A sorting domain-containing protein [Saprospiraceae bacterium]|nr:T9SS type A sorting domain-containing protein [Saprospiraceae bacterium]